MQSQRAWGGKGGVVVRDILAEGEKDFKSLELGQVGCGSGWCISLISPFSVFLKPSSL